MNKTESLQKAWRSNLPQQVIELKADEPFMAWPEYKTAGARSVNALEGAATLEIDVFNREPSPETLSIFTMFGPNSYFKGKSEKSVWLLARSDCQVQIFDESVWLQEAKVEILKSENGSDIWALVEYAAASNRKTTIGTLANAALGCLGSSSPIQLFCHHATELLIRGKS